MAEATIADVTKGLQQINETLRQQAIAEGKPDPAKFVKEEFVAILAQRSYAKKDRELQTEVARTVSKQEKVDQQYYKKQLNEQKATTDDLDKVVESSEKTNTYLQQLINTTAEGSKAMIEHAKLTFEKRKGFFANLRDGLSSMVKDFDKILGVTKGINALKGSADAEDKKKKKLGEMKTIKLLRKIAGGIGSLAMSFGTMLKDKAKAAVGGIFGILKKFLLGGLIIAAIAFLNSPKFKETLEFLKEKAIPAVANFIDKILKPLYNNLKTYFFDVIDSIKKFFDDPDFQKTIKNFKEGKILDGFKSFFTSIFKTGGLIDNLSTNLFNLFARIFGMKEIKGEETVFSMIGKQFTKFYARFQNFFRGAINTMFKNLGMDKRLDLIDEETGEVIESRYNKNLRRRREQEERRRKEKEDAINKFVDQEAKRERQKEAKRIAAMPDRLESGLVNIKKIKAEKALLDKEEEAFEKAKVAEILSTKKDTKSFGKARGIFGEKTVFRRLEKQRQILENLERIQAGEGGNRLADQIKFRQQKVKELEAQFAKQTGQPIVNAPTQVNSKKENNVVVSTTSFANSDRAIERLTHVDSFRG